MLNGFVCKQTVQSEVHWVFSCFLGIEIIINAVGQIIGVKLHETVKVQMSVRYVLRPEIVQALGIFDLILVSSSLFPSLHTVSRQVE